MTVYAWANNVLVTLAADLTAVANSVTVNAASAPFNSPPNPSGGVALLTLANARTGPSKIECVSYTGRTDNGNGTYTLTGLTRGLEGTSGQSWVTSNFAFQGPRATWMGEALDHGSANGLADDDHAQYLKTDGSRTLTGPQACGNQDLTGIKTAQFNGEINLATTTGAVTIDWRNGAVYKQVEPTGAITYSFTAPAGPTRLQLRIISDGTSSAFTHVFPGTVKWLGSTWAQVANKAALITFWWDGSTYWAMGANEV